MRGGENRRIIAPLPLEEPAACLPWLLARQDPEHPAAGEAAALVFGREHAGLTNEELQRCHFHVHIPSNPDFSSLNLAAAVQVLSYELRLAVLARAGDALASGRPMPPPDVEPPATADELEGYFRHLDQALHDIDFHKGKPPEMVMSRLRRLYLRAGLDADGQRTFQLATRDNVQPATRLHERVQDGERRVGLHRVTDEMAAAVQRAFHGRQQVRFVVHAEHARQGVFSHLQGPG